MVQTKTRARNGIGDCWQFCWCVLCLRTSVRAIAERTDCLVGGGTMALVFRVMLSNLTFRNALLIYSFINAALLVVAFLLVKDRPNRKASVLARQRADIHWIDTSLFQSPIFWSMALSLGVSVLSVLFARILPLVIAEKSSRSNNIVDIPLHMYFQPSSP